MPTNLFGNECNWIIFTYSSYEKYILPIDILYCWYMQKHRQAKLLFSTPEMPLGYLIGGANIPSALTKSCCLGPKLITGGMVWGFFYRARNELRVLSPVFLLLSKNTLCNTRMQIDVFNRFVDEATCRYWHLRINHNADQHSSRFAWIIPHQSTIMPFMRARHCDN